MGAVNQPSGAAERRAESAIPRPPSPYRAPLLRVHGTLRDITAQKSGERSDAFLKENVVPVMWT